MYGMIMHNQITNSQYSKLPNIGLSNIGCALSTRGIVHKASSCQTIPCLQFTCAMPSKGDSWAATSSYLMYR